MSRHLLDTNVLLRAAHPADPLHAAVRAFLVAGRATGDTYVFTTQNAIEMWNVLTRPTARNGYGLSPVQARRTLDNVATVVARLPDTDAVYPRWLDLVTRAGVSGVQVHDARLAAVALVEGIPIVTLNGGDFARFVPEGLMVVDPLAGGSDTGSG